MNNFGLGARIAQLRRAGNLTQEQLAGQLGLSYQAVSKWENEQSCPDVMLLPQLADIFGVSIDHLFGREQALIPTPAAEPGAEEEEARQGRTLPWPDDETLYAVLFKGHTPLTDEPLAYTGERERIRFVYSGPALNVSSHFDLCCENCEIRGSVSAAGDVQCGDVGGDVSAGGDVDCGNVGSGVSSNGDTDCGSVGGSVNAGGDVDCGSIGGNCQAGGDVDCGTVRGSVWAAGDVNAAFVGGHAGDGAPEPEERRKDRHIHMRVDLDKDDNRLQREISSELSSFKDDLRGLARDISDLFRK